MKSDNLLGRLGHFYSSAQGFCVCSLVALLLLAMPGVKQLDAGEVLLPEFLGPALPTKTTSTLPNDPKGITLGFDIVLNFVNTPSPANAAIFQAAEATWESILLGYQIDDIANATVTIDVNLSNIDGPGNILGFAGPTRAKLNAAQTAVSPTFLYTQTGEMTFDTTDIPNLGSSFSDVVLHEMGHVLGLGTLWSSSAVNLPGRQELVALQPGRSIPDYVGANGLAAYNAEFGQSGTYVPVEQGGGPGTAGGHWDEVDGGAGLTGIVSNITGLDLRNELMTGWLNPPTSFISSLSTQSFVDIGFVVVPEPSALLLVSISSMTLLSRRRRD